jgi:parallel beta-helix repeat protein
MRLALGLAVLCAGLAATASAIECQPLDADTQRCQQGVARAGGVYARAKLRAVQLCLDKIQSGALGGDPVTVCRGTPGVPPTDARTATKIARAEGRVAAILGAKCTDPILATMDVCAPTVAGLTACLVADHWAHTDAVVAEQYGTLAPTGDAGQQACQAAVAKEAGKYLKQRLNAVRRCLDSRNKRCGNDDEQPNCLFPSETSESRLEAAAARKIARAEAKMREKIAAECSDAEITALDACADTNGPLGDCLVCSHDSAAHRLVGGQYQAVHVATPGGPTLQSIADAAEDGDTILLELGTYAQTMEIKDSHVTVAGLKACDEGPKVCNGGGRPVMVNPGGEPNGITSCGSLSSGCTDIADGLLFQGFEVNDFDANDILTIGADGVTYRDMITCGPGTNPGTEYGLFPVLSNDVLIEDSLVEAVRDAGIYVGQSTNIIVRNNEVRGNVAGIEIENSANSEVHNNWAHDNTAGILVFKLVLPTQFSDCANVHDNLIENNNLPNYGSGLVGDVPRGTGMLILSNDRSIFQNNTITGHDSFGIVLTDQAVLNLLFDPDPFPTPSADFFSEHNFFVGNTQTGNGLNPDPAVPVQLAQDGTVAITGGSPGNGNCGDDVARYCLGNPMMACTSDAQCGGSPGACHGSSFWNVMPPCASTTPPGCPFVPPPTTTTSTSTTSTTSTTGTTALFTWTEVQDKLADNCTPCHTTSSSGNLTGLHDYNTGYMNIVNVPSSQLPTMDRVEPNDSTQSYLMHKLDGTHLSVNGMGDQMPLGGPYLSQGDRDGIRAWINAGALQN